MVMAWSRRDPFNLNATRTIEAYEAKALNNTWGSNYLQFSNFDPLIRGYDLLNCR